MNPSRLTRPAVALAAALLLCAAAEPDAAAPEPLEEVLVVGRQPGPGLWRVTRRDDPEHHVLWLLGDHAPLPRRLEWRSAEVEDVIRHSQVVIGPPAVDAAVGPLGGLTLLPSLFRVRHSPDGLALRELLPPDLYARWQPLKARYLGDARDVERWRPIFAASALHRAALASHGFTPYEGVWPAVEKLARRARVPVNRPELRIDVDQPRAAIREFKRMPLEDLACFERTLARLETDLDLLRERANAWAVGDVAQLRELAPVARATACIGALLESPLAQARGYGDLVDRARATWLEAVEQAIGRHASTLAVTSIEELLAPDGPVSTLRRRGYVIEAPGDAVGASATGSGDGADRATPLN